MIKNNEKVVAAYFCFKFFVAPALINLCKFWSARCLAPAIKKSENLFNDVSTRHVNELVETKSCDTIRQIINSLFSFITNLSFLSVFTVRLAMMFRLTRSMLALSGSKSSRFARCATTQSTKQHELQQKENKNDEETLDDESLDRFTKEFLGNKIKVSEFQRMLLSAGSSIAALLDPRRQDMIACLGETTGEDALLKILHVMNESDEGQEILKEKPRINTKTVNLEELKNMPIDTFGHHYYKFLDDNVSSSFRFHFRHENRFCFISK